MDTPYPGIHEFFNLASFPYRQQLILRWLSTHFYLTNHGADISLGSRNIYRDFLMKAPERIAEAFHLYREIIVIFSQYETFEPRTLGAFPAAKSCDSQFRCERACQILISNDPRVQLRLTEIIKSDPESPIIVPFYANEFVPSASRSLIFDRMRRYLSCDLFAFQSPLKKDLYFFGRSDLIQDLINRGRSGENTGVFGLAAEWKDLSNLRPPTWPSSVRVPLC